MRILFVMLLALMAGAAFSVNGAALQVTEHSTIPATVYPGTVGQLQLSVLNAGTDTADQVVVNYKSPGQGDYSTLSMGDIGSGSNAVASVPFTVPEGVSSGFFIMDINIAYFSDTGHSSVKNTPLLIPVEVLQHQVLALRTLSVEPQASHPGSSITVQLEVTNTGGVMNNVVISTPEGSSFTLDGSSQQAVGNIPSNASRQVSVALRSDSSTTAGKFSIPLVVSYEDSLQNTVNQTVSVGPVTVTDSSAQFRVGVAPLAQTKAGDAAAFELTIENTGDSPASAIVDINQTDEFTPIGATRIYFDSIPPGGSITRTVTIGVGASTSAGYYSLPLTITGSGQAYTQNIGIVVDAPPEVTVSTSTQPEFVSSGSSGVKVLAEIANTGNGQIRSVYAAAGQSKELPITGASDKFIGTLNVDDFATFQLSVNVPPGLAAGRYSIPITITFKDSKNQEHSIRKDVEVTVYSSQDAARLNGQGGTVAGGSGFRGNGGLSIGLNLPTAIGAIVLTGAGFFAYKRLKGKK